MVNIIKLSEAKPKFSWRVLEQDIFLTGMKGTGKTTRIKKILDTIPNDSYWIWSPQRPQEHFGNYGYVVDSIKKLEPDSQMVFNGTFNEDNFVAFLERAFFEAGNMVIVLDDLHENVTKHSVLKSLSTLVQSGRNRGISSIMASTNPAVIPNWILGNVSVAFGYRVKLFNHAKWLAENYFGDEAFLLLPKDMRKIDYLKADIYPDILPKGSYLMRNDTDQQSTLVINDLE